MKKKNFLGVHVGSSSILLLFIVLSLVSLAVLSLSSANADYRLSKKITARQTDYYNACNEIEHALSQLNEKCLSYYSSSTNEAEYFSLIASDPSITTKLCYPFSDLQSIQVTLNIIYPDENSKDSSLQCYEILSWKSTLNEDLNYDSNLNVIH